MPTLLSVSEAARRLGVRPKDISDAFYQRRLRDDLCPIIAGRRLIPDDYLEQIAQTLKLRLGQGEDIKVMRDEKP